MELYFSGTPAEFKETAQDSYDVQAIRAESSDDNEDDYGDGSQLPTTDGRIILCGTVCETDSKSFKLRLGNSVDVVQIFSKELEYPQWRFAVGDFVQVEVRFKPVQTANDTFLYTLIADKLVGHIYRRD